MSDSLDKAARAVRRTIALQARIAAGIPSPGSAPLLPDPTAPPRSTSPRPTPDTGFPDHPDRPERGDDLEGSTDDEVVGQIRRHLPAAAAKAAAFTSPPDTPAATGTASRSDAPTNGTPNSEPPRSTSGADLPSAAPGLHPGPVPAPDT